MVGVTLGLAGCDSGTGRQAPTARDPATASESPPACAATRVDGNVVRAGPFAGHVAPQYDIVNERFRLRVGRYRDRKAGLTQMIPWFVRPGAPVGRSLRVTGKRLTPRPGSFMQTLQRTRGSSGGYVFPSIIAPPAEGCWRVKLASGGSTARLTVVVRD